MNLIGGAVKAPRLHGKPCSERGGATPLFLRKAIPAAKAVNNGFRFRRRLICVPNFDTSDRDRLHDRKSGSDVMV